MCVCISYLVPIATNVMAVNGIEKLREQPKMPATSPTSKVSRNIPNKAQTNVRNPPQ